MTEHDRIRRDRALACDRNDLESLVDAIRELQSTDEPSLTPLHDELMLQYHRLCAPNKPRKNLRKEKHDPHHRHSPNRSRRTPGSGH